ncbi:MAG TPA: hypothetical protein DIS99_13455 [Acinetobacter johnsonii]|nr:hypothetical protein [Acinetobacter johnsonii]
MKERPILFSAPMVTAILEGRKTQTRRVVKSDLIINQAEFECGNRPHVIRSEPSLQYWVENGCPFGQVGDHLWVRETFMDLSGTGVEHRDSEGKLQKYAYATDCPRGSHSDELRKDFGLKWKPSIHMPRWASRILLEITGIRVERLQSISDEDAKAEGFDYSTHPSAIEMGYAIGAKTNFRHTWEQIYGANAWNKNPWVWVVEFKKLNEVAA